MPDKFRDSFLYTTLPSAIGNYLYISVSVYINIANIELMIQPKLIFICNIRHSNQAK